MYQLQIKFNLINLNDEIIANYNIELSIFVCAANLIWAQSHGIAWVRTP